MKIVNIALLFLLAGLLTACAGAIPWNEQNSSGVDKFSVKYFENGNTEEISFTSGKEKASVEIRYETPDGTKASYKATDIKAFDGQLIRGDVEKSVSKGAVDVSPQITKTLTDGVKGLVSPLGGR